MLPPRFLEYLECLGMIFERFLSYSSALRPPNIVRLDQIASPLLGYHHWSLIWNGPRDHRNPTIKKKHAYITGIINTSRGDSWIHGSVGSGMHACRVTSIRYSKLSTHSIHVLFTVLENRHSSLEQNMGNLNITVQFYNGFCVQESNRGIQPSSLRSVLIWISYREIPIVYIYD